MLPMCIRLVNALVDVISSLGHLKPLIFCMQFSEMLVQAMWVNESPLMQVLDRKTATILAEQHDIREVSDIGEMDDDLRKQILKGKDMNSIAKACNRYPSVTMEAKLKGRN